MALAPCLDCSRKISRSATFCPHCGRPRDLEDVGDGSSVSVTTLAIFLVVSGALSGLSWLLPGGKAYWFPGVLFGLGFALACRFNPALSLSFASVSGIIYYLALQVGAWASNAISELLGVQEAIHLWGAISGFLGAFLLLQVTALFYGHPVLVWRSAVVFAGTLIGFGLVESVVFTGLNSIAVYVTGYVLWQSVVGVLCYRAVRASLEHRYSLAGFSHRLRSVLAGPSVQLIGLLASLAALAQYFLGKEQ